MDTTCHISVMKQEVLDSIAATEGGKFLDCTLGGGGHVRALLKANKANQVVAADRDSRALDRASALVDEFKPRLEILHSPFSKLAEILEGRKFDGILADLGLSTDQLRENRGFSFNDSAALDMRMDESQEYSALNLINDCEGSELYSVLRRGGVGDEARAIVAAILKERPIERTDELAKLISSILHGRYREKKGNPATVVFQALRIAVNRELEELEALLEAAPALANPGARFVVISFHSLEDKAVAKKMRAWESRGSYPAMWRGPRGEEKPLGKLLTKKALEPSVEEVKENPAARSARIRVFRFN